MSKPNKLPNGAVAVYRAYDADGYLLYVGITDDPKRRILREHRARARWYRLARRVDVRVFPDRETALRVEAAAWHSEVPSWPQECDERYYDESFVEPRPINRFEFDLTPRKIFD